MSSPRSAASTRSLEPFPRAARPPGARRRDRLAVGVQDRRLVGRVVVAGHQPHRSALGPATGVLDRRLGVLDRPGPGDRRDDQPVFGVQRHVIPRVALVVVDRVGAVAVGLLLGDEGPLLIELDLGRPGGRSPRVRRGGPWRARRRSGYSGRRCWGSRGRVGRSAGRRTPRRRVPGPPRPSRWGAGHRSGACPCARRIGPCRRGGGACVGPCRGRSDGARSGFRRPACRTRGGRNSGSRSGSDLLPPDWSIWYESHSRPPGQEDFR